jgi:hypothetical protein
MPVAHTLAEALEQIDREFGSGSKRDTSGQKTILKRRDRKTKILGGEREAT